MRAHLCAQAGKSGSSPRIHQMTNRYIIYRKWTIDLGKLSCTISSTVRTFPEVRPCLKEVLIVDNYKYLDDVPNMTLKCILYALQCQPKFNHWLSLHSWRKKGAKKRCPVLEMQGPFPMNKNTTPNANPLEYLAKRFHRGSDHLSWCYQKLPRCRSWRIRALSPRWIVLRWQETKRFGCSSDAMRWLLSIINKMRFS